MPDLPEVLAAYRGRGYVLAPAGFGKTHLIAQAVSRATDRRLVLTHTYAGVNALRRKMRELGVRGGSVRVDTIASWVLRLCLAYPARSGWTIQRPSGEEWTGLYGACSGLLDSGFIRRIVQASYVGLYVDEYQDCSTAQHEVVLKLARDLPCCVLGDPLQGIFDFDGQPVDWNRDVCSEFECVGHLETPHRWIRGGRPAIGAWLRTVRCLLERGQPVDLSEAPRSGVTLQAVVDAANLARVQGDTCRYFRCEPEDSVVAIHKGSGEYKTRCHALARTVGGRFSSIEEIEGKAVFSFIAKIENARTNGKRLREVVALAEKCMTGVNAALPAATARGERADIRPNTRNPDVASAGNAYVTDPGSANMKALLLAVKGVNGVQVIRADLFNRMMGVLRKHALHPQTTLQEAADKYQAEFRCAGRPAGRRRLIGTTLLIKGLEFDHAIVLDAQSLSRRDLYVALTRGAKSITIISTAPILNPNES